MTRAADVGRRACAVLCLAVVAIGCGEERTGPPPDFDGDARAIAEIVRSDPAARVLPDVDHAIDTDRPVLAADLLEELGLRAMRQQVTRLEALSVRTGDGRTLRARAMRLYRARVDAYEAYRTALMRGLVDDERLLDALHTVSQNQLELLALERELRELAPPSAGEGEGAAAGAAASEEGAGLSGLPPIVADPPPPDDETPGAEPDGREEHPALLEDALPEM